MIGWSAPNATSRRSTPDCNFLDIMQLHLERMHYGQPILKPVYDHSTGTLVRPEYVQPREFVIVDGLLSFYTPVMRQFFDVKVFLAPREDLRTVWKVRRDTTKRGYTEEQVLRSMAGREDVPPRFIPPPASYADTTVHRILSDLTPLVDETRSLAGRRREKLKPVPPPDL